VLRRGGVYGLDPGVANIGTAFVDEENKLIHLEQVHIPKEYRTGNKFVHCVYEWCETQNDFWKRTSRMVIEDNRSNRACPPFVRQLGPLIYMYVRGRHPHVQVKFVHPGTIRAYFKHGKKNAAAVAKKRLNASENQTKKRTKTSKQKGVQGE